ncbi:MAG TPA: hypothetical protein VGG37_04335, partial [Opitutaceae bacterium]
MSLSISNSSRVLLASACFAAASLFQGCRTTSLDGKPDAPVVKRDKSGATDLISASKRADMEKMRQLLDDGADPNDSDNRE